MRSFKIGTDFVHEYKTPFKRAKKIINSAKPVVMQIEHNANPKKQKQQINEQLKQWRAEKFKKEPTYKIDKTASAKEINKQTIAAQEHWNSYTVSREKYENSQQNLKQNKKITLNIRRSTLSKIRVTMDLLCGYLKGVDLYQNKYSEQKSFGYGYEFLIPDYQFISTHEYTNGFWSQFLKRLQEKIGNFNYIWRVRFDSAGALYYVMYSDSFIQKSTMCILYDKYMNKFLQMTMGEDISEGSFSTYVKRFPLLSRRDYKNFLYNEMLRINTVKFSGCKKFLMREDHKFRAIGRSRNLANFKGITVDVQDDKIIKFREVLDTFTIKKYHTDHYVHRMLDTKAKNYKQRYFPFWFYEAQELLRDKFDEQNNAEAEMM